MKAGYALLATGLYVLLLMLVHVVHMRWLPVDVVFYAAIGDAVLAALLTGCLLLRRAWRLRLTALERGQLLVIWLLLGYAFAISVPTVIDRSLSFYLLEKLDQRGGAIRQERFADLFVEEYLVEHRLVDVRLTEQQASGTIVLQQGCVRLTERGRLLARFSRFYRQQLLPRQRLLLGNYSDALTDPFRHSRERHDYVCP